MKINQKRIKRHLIIALMALLTVAVLYVAFGQSKELWVDEPTLKAESVQWKLSMALAYSAILFLGVTLLIGPFNVLRQRPLPVNSMVRRDIGIWTAVLALGHMSIGMLIHSDGLRLWELFIHQWPTVAHPIPIRFNKFGLANFLGLGQGIVLLFLLLISNNRALKKLGLQRWKWGQRLTYIAFFSILAHGFLYQIIEERSQSVVTLFLTVMGVILLIQILGIFLRVRRRDVTTSSTVTLPKKF